MTDVYEEASMQPSDYVAEFQLAFETSTDPELWKTLVREEIEEVMQAIANLLKELQDVRYVVCGLANVGTPQALKDMVMEDPSLFPKLEAVMDLEKNLFTPEMVQEAFIRVHRSNMSKLGDDGKPIRREDGKILKGPNYREPDLRSLLA